MLNLTVDGQGALILGSIILLLDTVAVCLRVRARRLKRLSLAADDYWILLALVLESTYIGLLFWGKNECVFGKEKLLISGVGVISGGGGRALTELTIPELTTLFKVG